MGISTHILDTALGRPAVGVPVTLSQQVDGAWLLINEVLTDTDGRCKYLLPETQSLHQATYRVHFDTSTYYKHQHLQGLYPYVEIFFEITNSEQHYHIPLLLTANGYTTYRGS